MATPQHSTNGSHQSALKTIENKVRSSLAEGFEYNGVVQAQDGRSVTVARRVGSLSVQYVGIRATLEFEPPLRGIQGKALSQYDISVVGDPITYETTVVPELLGQATKLAQEHNIQVLQSTPEN